jgi:FKBP-type peptidyl-prolyl cis-trans isomerase (trigger factor)
MKQEIIVKKEIKEHAEVVLTGTLLKSHIETFWDKAVQGAQKEISLPGFRKGHVPPERLLQEVGVDFLWKQAAEMALKEALPDILDKEEVTPIAPLGLMLTASKKDEDVPFEITAIIPPSCAAGDYKAAAKRALIALGEEDFEKEKGEAIKAFRMQVRAIAKMKNPEEVQEGDAEKNEAQADQPLDDDEAKFAGFENGKTIEHFIGEEAARAVTERMLQKKRGAIAEELIKETTAQIPKVFIEEEAMAMLETFKRDVVNQGMEWNDYLKRVKKDDASVLEDLRPQSEKRITLDLAFGEIIKKEEIKLDDADKEKEDEIAHALAKQEVPHERAHQYAREQLLREKIWEVLGAKSEPAV